MRALVDAALKAAFPSNSATEYIAAVAGRVYPAGTLGVADIPAQPDTPYVQYAWGEGLSNSVVPGGGGPVTTSLRVYVYDNIGSFTRIDDIIRVIKDTILELVGQISTSGRQCTGVKVSAIGQDTPLPALHLNSKVITFLITAAI